jgi:hypothetical protein
MTTRSVRGDTNLVPTANYNRLMTEALGAVILDMDGVIRHWRTGPTHAVDKAYGLPEGTINSIALTGGEDRLERSGCSGTLILEA